MEATSALPRRALARDHPRRPILTNLDERRLTSELRSSLLELPLGGIRRNEIGLEGKTLIRDPGQPPSTPPATTHTRIATPSPIQMHP